MARTEKAFQVTGIGIHVSGEGLAVDLIGDSGAFGRDVSKLWFCFLYEKAQYERHEKENQHPDSSKAPNGKPAPLNIS